MRTRMKLSAFLGKRKTTLEEICEKNKITSHQALKDFLDNARVEHPKEEDTRRIFSLKKIQKRVQKNIENEKPKIKSRQSKRGASQRSRKTFGETE